MIIIDSNIPLLAEVLSKSDNILSLPSNEITNTLLIDSNCTALFIRSTTKVNKELLSGTTIRFIGTATTGIDHIETELLEDRDITFASAAGSNANSVAEYVLYSILKWCIERKLDTTDTTIGIIGFGNIGKLVGYYSHMLGIDVIVNDPPLRANNYNFPEWVDEYCELETLLTHSDIVTTHVPLTTDGNSPTLNLLSWNELDILNEDSLVIATSRGGVINEKALHFIAKEKNLSTVIDVWENEPNISVELAKDSLICTPHIAGHSYDGKLLGSLMMLQAFSEYRGNGIDDTQIQLALDNSRSRVSDFADILSLFKGIDERRKIDADSRHLISALMLDNSVLQESFIKLRSTYPIRRELLKP